jgi:hypothetical protein
LEASASLHDLIAKRYEQAATIVTNNLDFTEWDQAFPANRLLASATLDRLRHNAYCMVLDVQSYRAPKLAPVAAKPRPAVPSPPKRAILEALRDARLPTQPLVGICRKRVAGYGER